MTFRRVAVGLCALICAVMLLGCMEYTPVSLDRTRDIMGVTAAEAEKPDDVRGHGEAPAW